MPDDQRHEEYLRYSFKELMAEVALKIDRLATSLDATRGDLDRRVSALERGVPLGQDLVRRFLVTEQEPARLDRRLSILETEHKALSEEIEIGNANRKWLVGITVTTFLGMIGTATAVITLMTRLH